MVDLEVLELALAKEKASIEFYKKIIAEHSALKDIGYELLNEEEKHKEAIKKKIAELK